MAREFWEVYPIVYPSPQAEVRWELRRVWEDEEREEPSKLWQDHIDSINDFKAWKLIHPNDGTMVSLYSWSPYVLVGLSTIQLLTGNPLGFFAIYQSASKLVDSWSKRHDP